MIKHMITIRCDVSIRERTYGTRIYEVYATLAYASMVKKAGNSCEEWTYRRFSDLSAHHSEFKDVQNQHHADEFQVRKGGSLNERNTAHTKYKIP